MEDLTNLKTYIIDSNNPEEIDDAISLEYGENNIFYIWVHISYPVKLFEQGSKIDLDAQKKGSSIYLVDKYISMLPQDIIDEANLKQNKVSETISCQIKLDTNGQIKGYKLIEALIKPNYELTYDDTNELLDLKPHEEKELTILNGLLKSSFLNRKVNGAISFNTTYAKLTRDSNNISFDKVENTIAHQLVSEAMILMGYVISRFLIENNIPAPYRSQRINCDVDEILNRNNNSPIKYSILKQFIGKSHTSIKANKHESLGLNSYVQATSPLRRYLDLLVQRQLYLKLNNKIILSEDNVLSIMDNMRTRQIEINEIIKDNKLIYTKKFFNNNNVDKIYKIIFIRWVNNKRNIALVYFSEYYLEILITLYISIETYTNKVYKVKYNKNENTSLPEFIN